MYEYKIYLYVVISNRTLTFDLFSIIIRNLAEKESPQ